MRSVGRAKTHELNRIAESQHGVVTRAQALECGYSDSAIGRCIQAGLWERPRRGVYKLRPAPLTFEGRLTATILRAPGRTWASHRSAARLWRLRHDGPQVVEVSTTANLRGLRSVHDVATMPERDRTVVRGVPVTSVERTLADVGAVVPAASLEAMTLEAVRLRITTVGALRDRLDEGDAGRFGPPTLRRLLDRWTDFEAAESVLEARLRRLVRRRRLPEGVPQLDVYDGERFVARLDLAYPDEKIAVEADGYRWHGDPARWRADLARRNELTRLGWQVLHFTWNDLKFDEQRVAATIAGAVNRARKRQDLP